MDFAPLLLFWLSFALSQEHWLLVHHDGSVEAVVGTLRLLEAQKGDLRTAWVWNGRRAPRRVAPAQIGRQRLAADPDRLAVRVQRRAGARHLERLQLVAAPTEMWLTATEESLPRWPVPGDGRLSIPFDRGQQWQLRVVGPGEGSWWVEVRHGQREAFLTSGPAAGIDLAVFEPGGTPASGINAFIQEPASRGTTVRGWTRLHSGRGKLAVPGLPDEAEVAISILREGSPPLLLRGRPSELPHQVRLSAGAALTGKLLDRQGAPVLGANVEAESFATEGVPQVFMVKGKSGPDGAWRLLGVPAGRIPWRASAAGYAPVAETVEAREGQRQDLGTRTLEPGKTLSLQVNDDAGSAVAGANVQAGSSRLKATSDANGVARLTGLPGGPLEIKGSAPRHLAGALHLSPPFAGTPVLVLSRAFTATGRFVTSSGEAIPGATARVDSETCQRDAPVGADGRFDFDLPPGGAVATLVLRSPETQELRTQITPGEAGDLRDLGDLRASTGLTVTGRIVASGEGTPVPGARIWTTRQGADGPAVAWATRDLLEGVAGEDGRFRVAGLVPAPATLRVEAPGFARAQIPLALGSESLEAGEGGGVDLGSIALTTGATLHVRVDTRGMDAAGAVARADLGSRWLEPDMLTAQVRDGEATLPNVPAGKVLVSVLAGRKLLCEQPVMVQEGGDQEVDCRRSTLTVTGRVEVGGAPVFAGTLLWQVPSFDVPGRIDTIVSPGGLRQQQVAGIGRPQVDVPLDTGGRFETLDLAPGRWQVTWFSQGTAVGPVVLEIPEVEKFATVLTFSGLVQTGTVADREGNPVEGARVRELTSGALSFSAPDGSFTLAGLRPGKALVQAELRGQTSSLAEAELSERPPEPLRLVLGDETAPTLTVQALDASGLPAAGAFVFLAEEGKGLRLLTTAADGKTTITLEPPLAPRLRAAAYANGSWGFGRWTSREAAQEGISISVAGSGGLIVSSDKKEGPPAITTQDGWDLTWMLRLLGVDPRVTKDQPLQVTGLPAGQYQVALGGSGMTIAVEDGKVRRGAIE
jgi:hypothetical protein